MAVHKLSYHGTRRRFGLSAQMTARRSAEVADAYKLDQDTLRTFRATGSIAYRDRILTWHLDKMAVSIWTPHGRLKIRFAARAQPVALLAMRQGESDLILQKGAFYLAAT